MNKYLPTRLKLVIFIVMAFLSACHSVPDQKKPSYDWLQVENRPDCLVAFVRIFELTPEKREATYFISKNKATWSGDCVNGKAHGRGRIERKIDVGSKWVTLVYEGEIWQGVSHGEGMEIWPRGEKYVGDFVDGVWTGHGDYSSPDGTEYSGAWLYGMYHGPGELTFSDGTRLKSIWIGGNPGKDWIKITMPNGDRYEGDYEKWRITGKGVFYFANGDQCSATWAKGNIVGVGSGAKDGRQLKCFGKFDHEQRRNSIYFEEY
ncbi:hypothetical protein [uncultured Sneathiella sp.]|uniref:hypothetical protein n=1 Tax=uncultured Sneathiella sp. TaxID=879315 RepID=UPI0030DC9CE6|tara:strand:- start:573 stop:1358 length:786 start_codon:yes stop_codon:yes gene_type:complete